MGYQVYFNSSNNRWQGYGVPGVCDFAGCDEDIDYGLGFACESYDCGCEAYYCYNHLGFIHNEQTIDIKHDSIEWLEHILTDPEWEEFRKEHPNRIRVYKEIVEDN